MDLQAAAGIWWLAPEHGPLAREGEASLRKALHRHLLQLREPRVWRPVVDRIVVAQVPPHENLCVGPVGARVRHVGVPDEVDVVGGAHDGIGLLGEQPQEDKVPACMSVRIVFMLLLGLRLQVLERPALIRLCS